MIVSSWCKAVRDAFNPHFHITFLIDFSHVDGRSILIKLGWVITFKKKGGVIVMCITSNYQLHHIYVYVFVLIGYFVLATICYMSQISIIIYI